MPDRPSGISRRVFLPPLAFLALGAAATCSGPFLEQVVDASPPTDPWMKAVADLNGDGRPDLVICGRAGPLVWYENPTWTRRTIGSATGTPGSSTGLAVGDVDGNGSPDVVLANGVWFANPRPSGDPKIDLWTRLQIDATPGHDVALADLDLDGDLDVVKRNQGSTGNVIRVFRQNPGTTWTERTLAASAGEGLAVGDTSTRTATRTSRSEEPGTRTTATRSAAPGPATSTRRATRIPTSS